MAKKNEPPLVTGISPSLGPPGTKVTIRGENLGSDEHDLIKVFIGTVDCTMMSEWHSSKRITALASGRTEGELSIIVVTKAGGRGSSTVKFSLQFPPVAPYEDVGYWPQDERQTGPCISETSKNSAHLPESMNTNPLNMRTRALSEQVLQKLYPTAVGRTADLNSERFDPKLYLLKYHKNTKYADLRDGLQRMQTEMTHKAEEPISLMRANLPAVFQGLQNLLDLEELMAEDLEFVKQLDDENSALESGPFQLSQILNQCWKITENIFSGVLLRKDRADATRTTLGLLKRFKFLFQLPATIQENIRQQEYNLVINDYRRAKSLFSGTEVQTFKEVYAQVESIIDSFKELLKARLLRMPSGFEESKECIRYLTQLGVSYDPAWECVQGQSEWFLDQFNRLRANETAAETPTSASGPSETTAPATTQTTASPSDSSRHQGSKSGSAMSPAPVLYVEALCRLIRDHFPDFWRLGMATVGSVGQPRRNEWLVTVNSVVNSFLEKISISTGYLKKEDEEVVPPRWLPHCTKTYRRCLQDMAGLKDLSPEILRPCLDLMQGLRVFTTISLLRKTEKEISQLGPRESWTTEIGGEGEDGATTQLPVLYENLVNEMISMLQDIVVPQTASEKEIFENDNTKDETVISKTDIQKSCVRVINAFPACLKTMASKTDAEKVYRNRSETGLSVDSSQNMGSGGYLLTNSRSGKLIVLVNNCRWTRTRLNPMLLNSMSKLGFPYMARVQQETNAFYEATQNELLHDYVELKAGYVFGPIEMQMGCGEECGWTGWSEVTGVRHYMKSLLHACGAVHSELLLVSPSAAQACVQTVLIRVLEELRRCYQGLKASKEWDRVGRLQAQLDLRLLERTFSAALSREDEARSLFNCVLAGVAEGATPTPEENKLLDNLCNIEMKRMHYLIVGIAV